MKIVQVTYTTTPEYAEQNQRNIQKVMFELQALNHPGINYNACVASNQTTFIHTAFFQSDDDQVTLNELNSFKDFQKQLRESGLLSAPKQELLTLVGSSRHNIF